jgi:hypothetical protein
MDDEPLMDDIVARTKELVRTMLWTWGGEAVGLVWCSRDEAISGG